MTIVGTQFVQKDSITKRRKRDGSMTGTFTKNRWNFSCYKMDTKRLNDIEIFFSLYLLTYRSKSIWVF